MARKKKEKKRKEQGSYSLCWSFLKESKVYFLIVIFLLLFSVLIGYFYPVFFSEQIMKYIEQISKQTENMNFSQLLIFIIQNNLTVSFTGLLLGFFIGIFPFVMSIINGYVIGFVAGKTARVLGNGVLLRLLPHGIFELPALILSLGLGLRLGMFIFKKKGKKKKDFIYAFENSLRVFVYIILPLLIVAGLIEAGLVFLLK